MRSSKKPVPVKTCKFVMITNLLMMMMVLCQIALKYQFLYQYPCLTTRYYDYFCLTTRYYDYFLAVEQCPRGNPR
jgi:hypothetical protein